MQRTPYLPPEKTATTALDQLRDISTFALKTVPYYRDVFDRAGFQPQKLDNFNTWKQLPVIDKDIVRYQLKRMASTEAARLGAVWCQTSGSTGTCMKFLLDQHVNTAAFALFWRAWNMSPAWQIGKRQAALAGYAEGKWTYQWKTRILALSSFHLSPATTRRFYDLLKQYNPAFLRGYPSALYLFAKLLEQQGLELHYPVMFSGSETLLPFQREETERIFKTRLIDHYSLWERVGSIRECFHGNLHAENDFGWHEILLNDDTPAQPGQAGRLVCTSLHNKAMPLIRYDTRDLAVWSDKTSCPCGSRFPIIDRIIGRIEDVVLTPEGRLVGRLDAAFKYTPGLHLAQILQESPEHLTVLIATEGTFDLAQQDKLMTELRKRLGEQIKIKIKPVAADQIERAPNGKVRFVISNVPAAEKMGHF